LIASSIQVVAEDHGWEKWMNLPRERDRLYRLIRETGVEGVVFLSGDRHLAELSAMDGGAGYPFHDVTSSGLNQAAKSWRAQEVNRHRVATMNWGDNFGLVAIDRNHPDTRSRSGSALWPATRSWHRRSTSARSGDECHEQSSEWR
jgi:alkaline phosphatase D